MVDEIDIFDPSYLYPSNVKDKKETGSEPRSKYLLQMTNEERRQHYKNESEKRKVTRQVNIIRATDEYIRGLERQVVDTKTYLAVKDLNEDFNDFTTKYRNRDDAKKKDTEKKS